MTQYHSISAEGASRALPPRITIPLCTRIHWGVHLGRQVPQDPESLVHAGSVCHRSIQRMWQTDKDGRSRGPCCQHCLSDHQLRVRRCGNRDGACWSICVWGCPGDRCSRCRCRTRTGVSRRYFGLRPSGRRAPSDATPRRSGIGPRKGVRVMGLLVPASTILAALLIATLAVKGGIAGKGARVRALGFSSSARRPAPSAARLCQSRCQARWKSVG
jgi:hypothetical protein